MYSLEWQCHKNAATLQKNLMQLLRIIKMAKSWSSTGKIKDTKANSTAQTPITIADTMEAAMCVCTLSKAVKTCGNRRLAVSVATTATPVTSVELMQPCDNHRTASICAEWWNLHEQNRHASTSDFNDVPDQNALELETAMLCTESAATTLSHI